MMKSLFTLQADIGLIAASAHIRMLFDAGQTIILLVHEVELEHGG